MTAPMRPIMLSACARAATAEELGFRIDRPIQPRRGARVIALDDDAARVVRDASGQDWNAARFYASAAGTPTNGHGSDDGSDDGFDAAGRVVLRGFDGTRRPFAGELVDADVVVMVAAVGGSSGVADAIGRACVRRGIMTAGIILGDAHDVVTTLRPHAQVLLVTSDEQDLSEVLTALRA